MTCSQKFIVIVFPKIGSSAMFGVAVFKASIFNSLGGPLAVGSSAMFGVVVFKASIFNSLGGSISQSRFVCHVLCSSIQGIYFQFPWGVHWPKKVHLPIFVYWYSRHLCSITGGPSAKVIITLNNNNMKS